MITFQEYYRIRNDGTPCPPSKMKKLHHKEIFAKGVRDFRADLSNDYPGNIEFHGAVGPYKILPSSKTST